MDSKYSKSLLSSERKSQLIKFLSQNNIYNHDINIFHSAFTHKSYSNEHRDSNEHNERLEYIGDSVLELITNEYLYKKFPNYSEGKLSKLKSRLVSEKVLSEFSKKINLGKVLLMGKGEEETGGKDRASNLANLFEAVCGAIYLDSGLDEARKFILPFIKEFVEKKIIQSEEFYDYKTILQELVQKKYKVVPSYEYLGEEGPDHEKKFFVKVSIKGTSANGEGTNKRMAEQDAAKNLLKQVK